MVDVAWVMGDEMVVCNIGLVFGNEYDLDKLSFLFVHLEL